LRNRWTLSFALSTLLIVLSPRLWPFRLISRQGCPDQLSLRSFFKLPSISSESFDQFGGFSLYLFIALQYPQRMRETLPQSPFSCFLDFARRASLQWGDYLTRAENSRQPLHHSSNCRSAAGWAGHQSTFSLSKRPTVPSHEVFDKHVARDGTSFTQTLCSRYSLM
jgi:hypothetical protein